MTYHEQVGVTPIQTLYHTQLEGTPSLNLLESENQLKPDERDSLSFLKQLTTFINTAAPKQEEIIPVEQIIDLFNPPGKFNSPDSVNAGKLRRNILKELTVGLPNAQVDLLEKQLLKGINVYNRLSVDFQTNVNKDIHYDVAAFRFEQEGEPLDPRGLWHIDPYTGEKVDQFGELWRLKKENTKSSNVLGSLALTTTYLAAQTEYIAPINIDSQGQEINIQNSTQIPLDKILSAPPEGGIIDTTLYSNATTERQPQAIKNFTTIDFTPVAGGQTEQTVSYLMSTESNVGNTYSVSNPRFQHVLDETDNSPDPSKRRTVYGPARSAEMTIPFKGVPGGTLRVQYFDKSRMEVNSSVSNDQDPWAVTTGRLAVELMTGLEAIGTGSQDKLYRGPSNQKIAGDSWVDNGVRKHFTYADLAPLSSLKPGQNEAPNKVHEQAHLGIVYQTYSVQEGVVDHALNPATNQVNLPEGTKQVQYASYDEITKHNIPDVFLSSKLIQGDASMSLEQSQAELTRLAGRPLSEPYWAQIKIGNKLVWTMFQVYERRVLTFTNGLVEWGNIGQHYMNWKDFNPPSTGTGETATPVVTQPPSETSTAQPEETATPTPEAPSQPGERYPLPNGGGVRLDVSSDSGKLYFADKINGPVSFYGPLETTFKQKTNTINSDGVIESFSIPIAGNVFQEGGVDFTRINKGTARLDTKNDILIGYSDTQPANTQEIIIGGYKCYIGVVNEQLIINFSREWPLRAGSSGGAAFSRYLNGVLNMISDLNDADFNFPDSVAQKTKNGKRTIPYSQTDTLFIIQ